MNLSIFLIDHNPDFIGTELYSQLQDLSALISTDGVSAQLIPIVRQPNVSESFLSLIFRRIFTFCFAIKWQFAVRRFRLTSARCIIRYTLSQFKTLFSPSSFSEASHNRLHLKRVIDSKHIFALSLSYYQNSAALVFESDSIITNVPTLASAVIDLLGSEYAKSHPLYIDFAGGYRSLINHETLIRLGSFGYNVPVLSSTNTACAYFLNSICIRSFQDYLSSNFLRLNGPPIDFLLNDFFLEFLRKRPITVLHSSDNLVLHGSFCGNSVSWQA